MVKFSISYKEETDARSNSWRHCRFSLRMEQYQNEGPFLYFGKTAFLQMTRL